MKSKHRTKTDFTPTISHAKYFSMKNISIGRKLGLAFALPSFQLFFCDAALTNEDVLPPPRSIGPASVGDVHERRLTAICDGYSANIAITDSKEAKLRHSESYSTISKSSVLFRGMLVDIPDVATSVDKYLIIDVRLTCATEDIAFLSFIYRTTSPEGRIVQETFALEEGKLFEIFRDDAQDLFQVVSFFKY